MRKRALLTLALIPAAAQALVIYLGTPVKAGAFTGVVGLAYGNDPNPKCSGVLIARDMVLTAAHCVCGRSPARAVFGHHLSAQKGRYDLPTGDWRAALRCGQDRSSTGVDIAVVRLLQPATRASPIPYAPDSTVDKATSFRIIGFGAIDKNGRTLSEEKREAGVASISANCSSSEADTFGCQTGEEIVAGKFSTPDACSGDSGGPLLVTSAGNSGAPSGTGFFLAGITSRATKGAASACGSGGIYERLRSPIRSWILAAATSLRKQ